VRYSDFRYTNKMEKLIEELLRIRDGDDSSGTNDRLGSVVSFRVASLRIHFFVLFLSCFQSRACFFRSLHRSSSEWSRNCSSYAFHVGPCRSMNARAKAMHDFQYGPPTTLFLLSLGAGAVEINWTAANRIRPLNPPWRPQRLVAYTA
jgi:hypothetical protein